MEVYNVEIDITRQSRGLLYLPFAQHEALQRCHFVAGIIGRCTSYSVSRSCQSGDKRIDMGRHWSFLYFHGVISNDWP